MNGITNLNMTELIALRSKIELELYLVNLVLEHKLKEKGKGI